MRDIETIEEIVKGVLEENPSTRNSDTILYEAVCREMNPTACTLSFSTVMTKRAELGLPKYDTVGRARRKLQQKDKALRAIEKVTDKRFDNWKLVRDYATE